MVTNPVVDRARQPLPPFPLIVVVWLIPALLSGFDTYMQGRLNGQPPEWNWVFFNAIDWLLYAALTPVVLRISRRFPLEHSLWNSNLWIHLVGALGMCVAWAALGTLLRMVIFPMPVNSTLSGWLKAFASWVLTTLPFGTGVYFALVGVEHALFFFSESRQRETQAARLAAQLAEARLGALRMQLNPHFLFNSLNAITVLVRDQNTTAASRMLELLGEVLRQVLRTEPHHETKLSAELDFLRRYLEIEEVRFSDRLRPRIEVDPAVTEALVPSFILQPLVENALRHGIAQRADAGVLEIRAWRDGDEVVLAVRDDGAGLPLDAEPTTGLGLANTQARLAALYGAKAEMRIENAPGGGTIATVRLPYHEATKNARHSE